MSMIEGLSKAYEIVKDMKEWEFGKPRTLAKESLKEILRERMMEEKITTNLPVSKIEKGLRDRRSRYYIRHLLTELGDIILPIPRTRTYSPNKVIKN